jgi:hypothetical protein
MDLFELFQTPNFTILTDGYQRTKSKYINSKDNSAVSHIFWNSVAPSLD